MAVKVAANGNDESVIIVREEPKTVGPFEMTRMGLVVNGRPRLEDWIEFGDMLYEFRSAYQWTVGDWINYGEDRNDWAERYEQAITRYDFDYGYLRNMASVARKFPVTRRVTGLSWSHHQAVASLLPEQRVLVLGEAAKRKLPRDEVRELVAKIKKENGGAYGLSGSNGLKTETPPPETIETTATLVPEPEPAKETPPDPEPEVFNGGTLSGIATIDYASSRFNKVTLFNAELARALEKFVGQKVSFVITTKVVV